MSDTPDVREALRELVDAQEARLVAAARSGIGDTFGLTDTIDRLDAAWTNARAALAAADAVPSGFVIVDLNEYDGDDPRSDEQTELWIKAADAYEKAVRYNQRGFAEWECRMRAAIKVLAQPVAAAPNAQEEKIAFLDGTDWLHHVGHDVSGTMFYPTTESVQTHQECGIVRVAIRELDWPTTPLRTAQEPKP